MITKSNKINEVQIKQLIENWSNAFRAKDLDGVLSFYSPDIVSFDLIPPIRYTGLDEYRKPWEETFLSYQGPIEYEVHDLNIFADEKIAFSYSINRMKGTLKNGTKTELWLRWTACFYRTNDKWLIIHEQVSVPVDLESGKALYNLEPKNIYSY